MFWFRVAAILLIAVEAAAPGLSFGGIDSEDQEPIVVMLETEHQLIPVYLTNIPEEGSKLPPNEAAELQRVLEFDLNHNGTTQTVKHSRTADSLSSKTSFEALGPAEDWKKSNAWHVIKVRIVNKQLDARVFTIGSAAVKRIDAIPLEGDLAKDRKQIHYLADRIHKALFGVDGIASTRIIYTVRSPSSEAGRWLSDLWEADYDGANARKIHIADGGYIVTPAYIPPKTAHKSSGILYVSYKNGQPKIYLASLRDGLGQRLTTLRGNQLMPAISRQQDKIAFISDVTGNPDLFLQEFSPETGAIGKPRQIYTTHQATQGSPAFSPDGSKIAFVSNKDGSPRIYVIAIPAEGMKLKEIKAKLITRANRESTAPCWSPDGKKLAYCAKTEGTRQIWIYDFESDAETQLTQGSGNKENPSWAPNSLHLVYNSADKNASELYMINLNQAEAVKISHGQGEKRFPSWEPRGS